MNSTRVNKLNYTRINMHELGPRGTPTLPHCSTDGISPSGHDIRVLRQQLMIRLRIRLVWWQPVLWWHYLVHAKV